MHPLHKLTFLMNLLQISPLEPFHHQSHIITNQIHNNQYK